MENTIEVPFIEWHGQSDGEGIIKALSRSFCETVPIDINLLIALYTYECYDGRAFVLYEHGGKLIEVNASHCSCFGLEGAWLPEETTWPAILMRKYQDTWSGESPWNMLEIAIRRLGIERGVNPRPPDPPPYNGPKRFA